MTGLSWLCFWVMAYPFKYIPRFTRYLKYVLTLHMATSLHTLMPVGFILPLSYLINTLGKGSLKTTSHNSSSWTLCRMCSFLKYPIVSLPVTWSFLGNFPVSLASSVFPTLVWSHLWCTSPLTPRLQDLQPLKMVNLPLASWIKWELCDRKCAGNFHKNYLPNL